MTCIPKAVIEEAEREARTETMNKLNAFLGGAGFAMAAVKQALSQPKKQPPAAA